LPEGDNARQWRSLLNEAQIVLTQHPLNAQRARRGLPPVNSVWFWGAGVLPQWVRCGFARIYTNDETATALARLATRQQEASKSAPSPQPSPPTVEPLEERGQGALLSMLFPSPSPQMVERAQDKGDSSLLRGAAASKSAPSPQPSPPTINPLGEREQSVLLDLMDQREASALETDWLAPLDALLSQRKLAEVHLHFLDGERVTYKPAHRWRFWRRVKP